MTVPTSNPDLIRDYLDAVMRKDASAVERFFDVDVEYIVNGTPLRDASGTVPPISSQCQMALPWLGLHRGQAAVRKFLDRMHCNLEVTAYGPREVISEGNKAAAFGWFRLHALATDRTIDIAYAIRFEIRDGRFVKYYFLENTVDVASAFRVEGTWQLKIDGDIRPVPHDQNQQTQEPSMNTALSVQTFTSTEAGAWSNSYLVTGVSDAILFDVPMLRGDALRVADMISASGKTLRKIIVSHAHPDHFMSLDLISDRFPQVELISTKNVVADINADGPWMLSLLQGKIGSEAASRLVVPSVASDLTFELEGVQMELVEFGECEAKHIAALFIPGSESLLSADLVYNNAHLYLQERHLESWLQRLEELADFAGDRVSRIYPGHGSAAGLELISQTRAYLQDFTEALKTGDARAAVQRILAQYPSYHVKQFLTAFSIPAYFAESRTARSSD